MRNKFMMAMAMVLLALGCTNPDDCEGTECDGSENCSNCDETGTVAGSATVTIEVNRLGEPEDCMVHLYDTAVGEYIEESGKTFEVEAPVTYAAQAGGADQTLNDLFGFPIHVDAFGEYWAAPPQSIPLEDGDSYEGGFELFNLFEPGVYSCVLDKYFYDGSASDLKGEFRDTVEYDPQTISVNQDGKVEPQDDTNMGVIENGDYMNSEDDHLVLEVVEGVHGMYITESEIGKNFFQVGIIWPEAYAYDLRCDLEP